MSTTEVPCYGDIAYESPEVMYIGNKDPPINFNTQMYHMVMYNSSVNYDTIKYLQEQERTPILVKSFEFEYSLMNNVRT